MIERHIRFEVPASGIADFQRFFEEKYVPPMSVIDGFVSARILRPSDGDGELLMVLQFESAEASAAWRESAEHESLQPELRSLHSGMHIQGYETL
jgi:heme-degrading monooxygenase HmoA